MATFDPRPNLQDLIALHEERERTRPFGVPIRVHRAVAMPPERLRFTVYGHGRHLAARHHTRRCRECRALALAMIGDRLGVQVGPIVETVEDEPGQARRCLDCDDMHLCAAPIRDCLCKSCGGENIETEWTALRVAGGRP
jgi:hypothetical protein